jgi:acid phosphatase
MSVLGPVLDPLPRARDRRGGGPPAVTLLLLLAVVGLIASSGSGARATLSHPSVSGVAAAGNHTTPYIKHVVVIVLENEVLANVWGHGLYERYLAATYGNATNYYAACHPSAPNYLAMIFAVTSQCGSDAWQNDTNTTIGDLLGAAGYSWAQYAENLSANACSSPGGATKGLFAVKHVPFLYSAAVLQNQTFCKKHILPATSFGNSVARGQLPNYSFYTPNLCDDGHNGCGGNKTGAQETAQADAWLHGFLSPILNHTGRFNTSREQHLVQHTLFIVTWDEGLGSNAGYAVSGVGQYENAKWCAAHNASGKAVCGGHIYTAFVSPYSLGRTFTTNDSSYGLVRTVEWLFHLPFLHNAGGIDSNAGFPVMKSLFSFTKNGS